MKNVKNVSKLVVAKNVSKYYDYTIEVHYKGAGYEEILIDKGSELSVLKDVLNNVGVDIDELNDGVHSFNVEINDLEIYTPDMVKTYGIDVVDEYWDNFA